MRKWIFGAGIPALLIAVYVGYWFYLESQLRVFVEGWIEDQRAAGIQVSHGTITTGGFPFLVQADIPAPGITAVTGQETVTWQGETLQISFPPWDFLTYQFDSPGEHLIAMIGTNSYAKWSVQAGTASGSWSIGSGGAADLTLALDDVSVVDALEQTFTLGSMSSQASIAAVDAPADADRVTLLLEVTDFGMPEALAAPYPPLIESLVTDVRLVSPVMPSSLPLMFLVMRDYDGVITLSETNLVWGELRIATEGALRVDGANYLTGRFPTRIAGYAETIDRLEAAGMLDGLGAIGLRTMAGAMAQSQDGEPPTVTLDINLVDGAVKVQDVTVMQMEPVPVAGAQS